MYAFSEHMTVALQLFLQVSPPDADVIANKLGSNLEIIEINSDNKVHPVDDKEENGAITRNSTDSMEEKPPWK